ncbi:ABC transporter ATP-binding protein [Olsenella sp. YH-ols2217]|uniref:ABC transporter ATP-binding protein n=1 Tax=Kribbibacterium absianum TaxID=3044210 RepID=A0ABT6ZIR4_9ACTN|nr:MULTISPECIES: ABC transporter ATP-binding protein [unclassified Olsenella]MDJ1121453.1 ABC transporter ATP-binding protein [Olsenella sp. YH-ols2216]MDJ1128943.1 ABC transporter ATP-binding protein [Olsenella sp. YH-ols2217]
MEELARRFFPPYRRYLIWGPVTKCLEVGFDLLTPLVIAWMIDSGVNAGDTDVIWQGVGLLAGMAFLGFGVTLICQKMASLASQGVGTDIRAALIEKMGTFSAAELDRFGAPTLVTRTTNDVNQLQLAISMLIRQLIRWPALAVGSVVCALAIDVPLGLVFCVCLPVLAAVFYLVMSRSVPFFAGMQAKLDAIGRLVRETASGVRPIRAFNREAFQEARFREASQEQADMAVGAGRLTALLSPATFLVMNVGIACVLWLGGGSVTAGRLEQGQVMALIGYMNQLLVSIAYIANLVVIFTRAAASAERVEEVLACEPTVTDAGVCEQPTETGAPVLEMERVSFSFPNAGRPALMDVSLVLEPGQSLGVIGGTGSGKSALASLVPRLYDATEGSVRVAGRDVRDLPLSQLRRLVAFVPQRAELVSGTVRDNLRWRGEDATDDELWAALEAAQAADFVRRLPEGLDAPVEPNGRNFSGGQRQRLTVARALVEPSALVVLDDSASALDYATDAALRRALAHLPGSPARLVISQRISTVSSCDQVLVLDQGQVMGLGTHDELLAGCPLYREIADSQLRQEEAA